MRKVIKSSLVCFLVGILQRFLSYPGIRYGYSEANERYQMMQKASTFVDSNWVEGDYLEFGVGERSFLIAHNLLAKKRHLWGFDSFQGLPEPTGIDKGDGKWKEGQYTTGLNEFITILAKNGIRESEYTLVKGFYDEVLTTELQTKRGIKKAAIVHIDCDLYESTKLVLKFILPLLQTGTILLFDDYYCFKGDPEKGEALALQEFLASNPNIVVTQWLKYHFSGNSFIVKTSQKG